MSERLQLGPYHRADLSPGKFLPGLRLPNQATPLNQIPQRIRLFQVLSAAPACYLDVSFPIDHFQPDRGGNGFRRTASDSRRR